MNDFEVFGLPRKLGIDQAALQAQFYTLSRRWHPDFQQAAPPADQARALEQSARLNAAYRTLRDPIARIEYLVRLEEGHLVRLEEGRETKEGAPVKPAAPPELLEEMLEIQEMLQEVKAGGLDAEGRARLIAERDALAARQTAEEARLTGPLSAEWDRADPAARPAALDALKRSLATRAYLRTVIDDLNGALEDDHVAHHRH